MPYLTPSSAATNTICRRLLIPNEQYMVAAVNGALTELLFTYNWNNFRSSGGLSAQDAVDMITPHIEAFFNDQCEGDCSDDGKCTDYTPASSFITFAPADPRTNPTEIPAGYPTSPFYIAQGTVLSPYQAGDIITEINRFPVYQNIIDAVTVGLPRFRVNVVATQPNAVVELHLIAVPQGGYAFISVDGNPLMNELIDLNSVDITDIGNIGDIFNIILDGTLSDLRIHEVNLETVGAHYVDVTFFPNAGTDIVVGFGGGLRKVQLCGAVPAGSNGTVEFRLTGCILEYRTSSSSAWTALGNVCGADGQDGSDGRTPVMGNDGGVIWWGYADNPLGTRQDLIDLSQVGGGGGVDLRCKTAWGMAQGLIEFHYIPAIISIRDSQTNGVVQQDAIVPAFQAFDLAESITPLFDNFVANAYGYSIAQLDDIVQNWQTFDMRQKLALAFYTIMNDCALFTEPVWDDILPFLQGVIDTSPAETLLYESLLAAGFLNVRAQVADFTAWADNCDCENFDLITVPYCRLFAFDVQNSQLGFQPQTDAQGDLANFSFGQFYAVERQQTNPIQRSLQSYITLAIPRPVTITSGSMLIYLDRADEEFGFNFICEVSIDGDGAGTPMTYTLNPSEDGYVTIFFSGTVVEADSEIYVTAKYYTNSGSLMTTALLTVLRVTINGEAVNPIPFTTGAPC